MVLNERLIDTVEKFDLISQKQIGFLKGFRTTDHSFIINSNVNKLVKENNKTTYLALVDLRKAYDRVDKKSLIYKLRQRGISGKFLATLEAMLQNIELIPKIGHSLLPGIIICMGPKQGDNLSPLEFNFFFDDVREIFDEKCDSPSTMSRYCPEPFIVCR